jgi:hypothetical protein
MRDPNIEHVVRCPTSRGNGSCVQSLIAKAQAMMTLSHNILIIAAALVKFQLKGKLKWLIC